jgi:UDP-glucuronate 4-epimerase
MRYLVTGGAGFIGSHVVERLLARGDEVLCVDNFNTYYDPQRKRRNITTAQQHAGYTLIEGDIRDAEAIEDAFDRFQPQRIAHLAAMPGPRPSIAAPALYSEVNLTATVNLLDLAQRYNVENFVLASTSSVYGATQKLPFVETDPTDRPLSPYAATKKAAEVLAHTFQAVHKLPISVVRFFTVYGPRGRPDMTPYLFVDRMVRRQAFVLFNGGVELYRDYTFVDDIVSGVVAALDHPQPYEIYNLGHSQPVEMRRFVKLLESITGLKALIDARPLPPSDPPITFADTRKAQEMLGYTPAINIEEGLSRFWAWYQTEVLHAG